jgi:hypothetical protein
MLGYDVMGSMEIDGLCATNQNEERVLNAKNVSSMLDVLIVSCPWILINFLVGSKFAFGSKPLMSRFLV